MAAIKDYPKAKQKIDECQNILANAETLDLHNKDNSVHNLVSSAMDIMMRVIDAQATTLNIVVDIKDNRAPTAPETERSLQQAITDSVDALTTIKQRAKTIVKEVGYSLQMAQAQISGDDISNRKLIVTMYDYTACNNNRCKENDIKSVKTLTGREED